MIHLMELPNPDPLTGRPEHGGRDRHTCIAIRDVSKLKAILDKAGNFLLFSSLSIFPCRQCQHVLVGFIRFFKPRFHLFRECVCRYSLHT